MTKLYLDETPETDHDLRKTAGYSARLSENHDMWPQELTSELYKQMPYLSDYDVNVNLDRVDTQKRFAHGYADIANKTERPETEHDEAGLPHIRIPIVVSEGGVKPFSTFLDGERVLPLNEDRVREQLFQPATFDLSTSQPRDPSLMESVTPPMRMGGGGAMKMASARNVSVLRAIAPTISERDADAFVEKVASDRSLQAGFRRTKTAGLLVDVFEKTKRASASERLQTIADRIEPTVVTVQKLPGGDFLVKSAATKAFAENANAKGKVVPAEEAAEAIGPENAQAMQPGQTVTAVADPVTAQAPMENKAKVIEEFGQYKVQDSMGNAILGHVFPKMIMWDGSFQPQPMSLFSNGSVYAVQDSIAGEFVGKGAVLPADAPRGDGCFYYMEGGEVCVTAPLTIGSSAAGPDGLPRFMATDLFGNQLSVVQVEHLKLPEQISQTEFAIPMDWKFMRLNNQTQLAGDPGQVQKTASARSERTSITLFYNGAFNLAGGCGLEKMSSAMKHDLDPVHAEFMLGLFGVDGITAKMKVAECRRKGSVKIAGLKDVQLLSERYQQSEKVAHALLREIPDLRRDLIKEAAALPAESPEGTVDNVLALNFVNPENLSAFVDNIPALEQTSEHLAEMLLSSQLGVSEIPEGAVERSMRAMEEVITGLKAVAYARN